MPLKKNSTLGFPVDSGRNQPDGGPTGRMAGAQRGWRTRSRKPRGGPASATGHAPRLALARTALQTTLRYSQCLSDIIKIRTRFRACCRFDTREACFGRGAASCAEPERKQACALQIDLNWIPLVSSYLKKTVSSLFMVSCFFFILLSGCSLVSLVWAQPSDAASTAQAHADRGIQLMQNGQLSEAELELRQAVQLSPKNATFLALLGGALGMQQSWRSPTGILRRPWSWSPTTRTPAEIWRRTSYSWGSCVRRERI